jgi:hypothetical protein
MKEQRDSPKQVVYILGAGATQAEAAYQGGEKVNLLMKDSPLFGEGISTRVLKKARKNKLLDMPNGGEIDIEKLISLLSATGIEKGRRQADKLRQFYYEEILDGLTKSGILNKPELSIGLLEMHKNKVLSEKFEKLTGIINLNHDNLFQVASQRVHGCIFLGFKFKSKREFFKDDRRAPLIIKPHGSFDWRGAFPIQVLGLKPKSKYSKNMLWIPPTILKESKDYPYNKLSGLAYEALAKKCNVLRIIGCSLSQNDWNMISLLFNSQYSQYLQYGTCFKIELIMGQRQGEGIKNEYSYLQNIFPIGYLTDGKFDDYKKYNKHDPPITSELSNPYLYWLKTKVQYHIKRNEFDLSDMGRTLNKILGLR